MNISTQFAGILAVVAGVLIFVSLFLERLGDAWTLYDAEGQMISLVREQEKGRELDQQRAGSVERLREKDKIAARVLSGKLTLFEAATRFAQMGELCPGRVSFRQLFPGTSEEEKMCRQVIAWVDTIASRQRSANEAARVRHKLTAQLQKHLPCYGAADCPVRQTEPRRNKIH